MSKEIDLSGFDEEVLKEDDQKEIDLSGFDEEISPPVLDRRTTPIEAGIKKFAQEGTFGFLDEVKGFLESAGSTVGLRGLGGRFEDIRRETDEEDKESLLDIYRETRDRSKKELEELEERHPTASTVGTGLGIIAPIIATGGAGLMKKGATEIAEAVTKEGLKTGLKKSLPQAAKQSALVGAGHSAAYAAGTSEADLTKGDVGEFVADVGTGGLTGAAFGAITPSISSVMSKAAQKMKGATKTAFRLWSGIDKKNFDKAITHADQLGKKVDLEDLGGEITDDLISTAKKAAKKAEKARDYLSTKKLSKVDDIKEFIKDRVDAAPASELEGASSYLENLYKKIDSLYSEQGKLSMYNVQEILDDVYQKAWEVETSANSRNLLRRIGNGISSLLKEGPDEYKKLITESKDLYRNIGDIQKVLKVKGFEKFGVDDIGIGEGKYIEKLLNKDKITSQLKQVLREDRKALSTVLKDAELQKVLREGVSSEAEISMLQNIFDKFGVSNVGSYYATRAAIGGVLGTVMGGSTDAGLIGISLGLGARPLTKQAIRLQSLLGKIAPKAQRSVKDAFAPSLTLNEAYKRSESLQNLVNQYKDSSSQAEQRFAGEVDRMQNTDNENEKAAIEYNLQQQPAFRKMFERANKKKKE